MSLISALPYEWQIGWRYTRAGRAGRRNAFISFISFVSVIGIALGVMTLIVVLSVVNGFQKDVRDRMLEAVAHVEILQPQGEALPDWQAVAGQARQDPAVQAAAPFIAVQSLLAHGESTRGAIVRGVLPGAEPAITGLAAQLAADGTLAQLVPGQWRILLGAELARTLGVQVGGTVTLIAPGGQVTPAGVLPRLKQFTVAGVFSLGHYEYDSAMALIHLDDAARLYRTGGPTGVQLKLSDVHQARAVGSRLAESLGPQLRVRDWTRTNAAWYDAVQIEKRILFIVLSLIVAVAAFNLISTLVMTVTDKQADIAILRTLGASPRSVMGIFVVQGAAAGIGGTLAGVALGSLLAWNIDVVVPAIERLLGVAFLPMPSDPQMSDILPIALISLALAFVATLYPSWRASRINPAQALRYE